MVCQPVYTQLAYIQPVYTWSVYTRSVYTRPVYKWSLYTGLSTLGLSIPALLSTHRLLCMWESRPSQPGAEMFLRCGYSSSSSPKPVPRGKKEGMGSALLGLHSALSKSLGTHKAMHAPTSAGIGSDTLGRGKEPHLTHFSQPTHRRRHRKPCVRCQQLGQL